MGVSPEQIEHMQTALGRLQVRYSETTPEFWALRGRKVRIVTPGLNCDAGSGSVAMPASINERVRGNGDLAETGRSR